MEPMQRERARPASGIGSDDRRSFRADCYEQQVQLVAHGAITNEAVGVCLSGARGGVPSWRQVHGSSTHVESRLLRADRHRV